MVWNEWAQQVTNAIDIEITEAIKAKTKTNPSTSPQEDNKKKIKDNIIKDNIYREYAINFSNYSFDKALRYNGFIFPITVNFGRATFSNRANFNDATFSDEVDFNYAIFSSTANFNNSLFNGKKPQHITFLGAIFKTQSFFNNLKKPLQEIPIDFRQTEFNLPPLVDSFSSDLAPFKKVINKLDELDFHQQNQAKFRVLKQLAEANNNHLKAAEFYACELYCHRRATGRFSSNNWFNLLYSFLSNYGLSLKKPLIFWLLVMLLSFTLQAIFDKKTPFHTNFIHSSVNWERVFFYINPSMPPFIADGRYLAEVRKRLYPTTQKTDKNMSKMPNNLPLEHALNNEKMIKGVIPTVNRIIRFLQKTITFISLFLMGLALRNRFKI